MGGCVRLRQGRRLRPMNVDSGAAREGIALSRAARDRRPGRVAVHGSARGERVPRPSESPGCDRSEALRRRSHLPRAPTSPQLRGAIAGRSARSRPPDGRSAPSSTTSACCCGCSLAVSRSRRIGRLSPMSRAASLRPDRTSAACGGIAGSRPTGTVAGQSSETGAPIGERDMAEREAVESPGSRCQARPAAARHGWRRIRYVRATQTPQCGSTARRYRSAESTHDLPALGFRGRERTPWRSGGGKRRIARRSAGNTSAGPATIAGDRGGLGAPEPAERAHHLGTVLTAGPDVPRATAGAHCATITTGLPRSR